MIAKELRKTGIGVIGDIPWGTHFCHFYETKQDLLDTLVPYFKTGLESKEFCLWVVSDSELITVDEAKGALERSVSDLDRHLADGNIEILNGIDWYLEKNAFNLQRVTSGWDAKLSQALDRGYEGMRVSGDTFWLGERDWKDFCAYEKRLNDSLADRRLNLLCTYPLAKSGAAEVLDVVHAHQFAVARRQGEWQIVETPELIQAKAEIKRLNEELEQRVTEQTNELRVANEELRKEIAERQQAEDDLRKQNEVLQTIIDNIPVMIRFLGPDARVQLVNRTWERTIGWSLEEVQQRNIGLFDELYPDPQERQRALDFVAAATGEWADFRIHARDGRVIDATFANIRLSDGTNISIGQDITERLRSQQALELFRTLIDQTNDAISVIDSDTLRFLDCNESAYQNLGYTREEFLSLTVYDIDPQVNESRKARLIAEMNRSGSVIFESIHQRKDGSTFPVEINLKIIRLERDYRLAVVRDITERKRAEDALRTSEDRLRLVIDTTPIMSWSNQPDGVVDFLNQRWTEYTGLSLEEYAKDPQGPIYPEDIPRVYENWRVAEADGKEYEQELRLRGADGKYRWFLVRTSPLKDEQGNVIKWYGVSVDIEDRKRAEEKLKQSESQLSEAQRLAHIGSWNWDVKSNTVTWSAEMYSIYGLNPDVSDPTYEIYLNSVHPEDREFVKAAVQESLRTSEPFSHSDRIIRPDGEVRILYSQGHVVRDERGDPTRMFGTCQDMTEEKRAEEQLKATTEQLRALSASLRSAREDEGTRIAREIHDELGSALTSLRWDLESFDKSISESTDLPQLQILREKIEAMVRLTETAVGTVRRISSELRPTVLDDLGLAAAIEWQTEQFQARTGIVCRCDCSLDDLDLSRETSTAVFRIFQEALTNILRHAQATSVEIAIKAEGGMFILTVKDNGRGITEDERTGSDSLGLLGMQERAHLVGGEIVISRAEAKGTVINLRVPISG